MANTRFGNLLEEALEGWEGVRNGFIAEAENIPETEWERIPADGSRTVRGLVEHVLESSCLMKELLRHDGDFRRAPYPDLLAEHTRDLERGGSRDQLLSRLRENHRKMDAAFRAKGELHALQMIRRFDGLNGTRLAWFHHGVAHEYYHCGQLALLARLRGNVPALTRRILAG